MARAFTSSLATMRVRDDWQRIPIAALLLFLVPGVAIGPPEFQRRSNAGSRSRTGRTLRLTDQAFTSGERCFDSYTSDWFEGTATSHAILPRGEHPDVVFPFFDYVSPKFRSGPSALFCIVVYGRAPPSADVHFL